MTATVTATFATARQSTAALEALYDAGFIDGVGVWSARQPAPTVEVRGSLRAVEVASSILRDHRPSHLELGCHGKPLSGDEVDSSAHTQQTRPVGDGWRGRRAEAASRPQAWARARRAVRYGGQRPGQDGFGGQVGSNRSASMRDRYVAVRPDQGPRTLTGDDGR